MATGACRMCRKRDGYEEKREGGGIVKRKKYVYLIKILGHWNMRQ